MFVYVYYCMIHILFDIIDHFRHMHMLNHFLLYGFDIAVVLPLSGELKQSALKVLDGKSEKKKNSN